MAGRPTDYTPELAIGLCSRLADGRSIRSVCSDDDMPDKSTVFRWLATNAVFRDQYELACDARSDALVEEMLDIADDGTNDWVARYGGTEGYEYNGEHVQRSRLRVDARKWIASKLKPKKYGDKVNVEATGKDGAPLPAPIVQVYIPSNARD
jgi:terminase small subunit-like protein